MHRCGGLIVYSCGGGECVQVVGCVYMCGELCLQVGEELCRGAEHIQVAVMYCMYECIQCVCGCADVRGLVCTEVCVQVVAV